MQSVHDQSVQGTVVAIGQSMATIRLSDGQQILWPLDKMDPAPVIGSSVYVYLNDKSGSPDQSELAKSMLNQLLKPSTTTHDKSAS